jgi:hypothetical protein
LIAGISGAVLIIVMFLGWWGVPGLDEAVEQAQDLAEGLGVSVGGGEVDDSITAWQAADFMDIIWFITGVVALGLAVATAMSRSVSLPVAASALTAGLGILSTILILYRILDPPYDLDRKFWVFVGLVAAGGIAYGGWRSMQEEGTTFGGEADRLQDRLGGDEPGAPPPPPPPPSSP